MRVEQSQKYVTVDILEWMTFRQKYTIGHISYRSLDEHSSKSTIYVTRRINVVHSAATVKQRVISSLLFFMHHKCVDCCNAHHTASLMSTGFPSMLVSIVRRQSVLRAIPCTFRVSCLDSRVRDRAHCSSVLVFQLRALLFTLTSFCPVTSKLYNRENNRNSYHTLVVLTRSKYRIAFASSSKPATL